LLKAPHWSTPISSIPGPEMETSMTHPGFIVNTLFQSSCSQGVNNKPATLRGSTYVNIPDIDDHIGLIRPDRALPAEQSTLPLD
jgi:hypothetical protein